MKTIAVSAGGTATAWSICNALRTIAGKEIKLIVCDINERHLVHSAVLADIYEKVPPIKNSKYEDYMLNLFQQHKVDIFVPLIDWDIAQFPKDKKELIHLGILSTAPTLKTFNQLSNKYNMTKYLPTISVKVPKLYNLEEVDKDTQYFVKPITGFGSRDTSIKKGGELMSNPIANSIIQELCMPPEITVDIYNKDYTACLCRERLETKAGVCTKARIFNDNEINEIILRIAQGVDLPVASNAQFMKNNDNKWVLTDFNLRLGAGSALSAAVGFRLAEAAVLSWLNLPKEPQLQIPTTEHFVVRHYSELLTV